MQYFLNIKLLKSCDFLIFYLCMGVVLVNKYVTKKFIKKI